VGLTGRLDPHKLVTRLLGPRDLPRGFQPVGDTQGRGGRAVGTGSIGQKPPDKARWAMALYERMKRHAGGNTATRESVAVTIMRWEDTELPHVRAKMQEWIDRANLRPDMPPMMSLEVGDLSVASTWGGQAWVLDGNWTFQVTTWIQPTVARRGSQLWNQHGRQWAAYTRGLMGKLYPRGARAITSGNLPGAQFAPSRGPSPDPGGIDLLDTIVVEPVPGWGR
jgi:hypothetical protein